MSKKKKINAKLLPVISFSGKKGFGKDFWANYVKNNYSNIEILAYADDTRTEVDEIMKMIEDNLPFIEIARNIQATIEEIQGFNEIYQKSPIKYPELNSRSRTDVTLKLLQYWGTNTRRINYGKDYWVDKTFNRIKEFNKKGITCVISDARFPNEVEAVHRHKGLAVKITISKEEQARRLKARDGFVPDITQLSHVSETGLDNYDKFNLYLNTEFNSDELTASIIDEAIQQHQQK